MDVDLVVHRLALCGSIRWVGLHCDGMAPTHLRPAAAGMTRIARDCYVDPAAAQDLIAICAAALQCCPLDTTVAFTTAGRVHELWLPELPDEVHLAMADPRRRGSRMTRTRRPEFVGHRLQLRAEDRVLVHGLAVTSLARTFCDLGAVLSLPDLVAAGDSALRAGASSEEIESCVSAMRRSRGIRRVREAVPLLDPRSRSRPESHLRVAVSGADMPRFEVNEAVSRDVGGWLAEPDLSLEEARIALEYQGKDHADLARMRRDMTRVTDMRREGWLTFLYGPAEVFGRPWEIRGEVRAAIRARAPHLLRAA